MAGMTGGEIAKLLLAACEDAGLSAVTTNRLMLSFSIRWGEQLQTELDRLIFSEMTAGIDEPPPGGVYEGPEQCST